MPNSLPPLPGRLPRHPRRHPRILRRPRLRRPALLPLQRRHHLPRRQNGFRPQRRLGQIPRPRIQSRIQPRLARRLSTDIKTQWLHLGLRHRPRHPFRRLRHAAARLQAPQRHFLGQAQPTSQSLLPLFHPRHRNHHLGRQRQKVPPYLPLQANEGNQSRQANEIGLGNPSSRVLGEKIRQAPHAKARRPPRAHPPSLHQRRRPRPRSLRRQRHHITHRIPPPPSRRRLRTLSRLRHPFRPPHLFRNG